MKATVIGASWLAGICLAYFDLASVPVIVLTAALAAFAGSLRLGAPWGFAAGLLLIAGSLRFAGSEPAELPALSETELSFTAVVTDDPRNAGPTMRFPARIEQSSPTGWDGRSIVIDALAFNDLEYGDQISVFGTVLPLSAEEPYDQHLLESGLSGRLSYPDSLDRLEGGHGVWWREPLVEVRDWASGRMDSVLPEPMSALARGMVLGERSDIDRELRRDLSAAGISHLIAISGQNIVLLAALITALAAPLAGRRWAAAIAMAGVLGYALFLGAPPAILRATMMASLFVLAPVFGRQSGGVGALMLTGMILTAVDPQIVGDLSFQLSFAAVGGLMILSSPISECLSRFFALVHLPAAEVLTEVLAVTAAAWLATLPIIAINFETLSLVGIGANVLVVAAFTPMLVAALLTIPASYLPGNFDLLLSWPAWALFAYFRWVGETVASLPTASISVSGFTSLHAACFYAALLAAAWLISGSRPVYEIEKPTIVRPGPVVFVPALVVLNLLVWPGFFNDDDSELRVSFLDVGQGDAILVETPGDGRILIDGGSDPARLIRELDEALGFGSRRIDLLLVTHIDTDHASGTIAVLERYNVELVAWNGFDNESSLANAWNAAVDESDAKVFTLSGGDELHIDDVSVKVLWPLKAPTPGAIENESSLVLRLAYGEANVLLTGDIGFATETALLAGGLALEAEILKVAHHGSAGSSLQEFLIAVDAEFAVVQSGASNSFGHPTAAALSRLVESGATVVRNDLEGTITFVTDGETLWLD